MTAPIRPFWRRLIQAVVTPKTPATIALLPPRAGLVSAMRPLALEQRFMFDGAAVDAAHAAEAGGTHDAAAALWVPQAVEVRAANPALDGGKKEVVLVDTSVADYKTLEAGVRDGMGIVEFDGSADGLAQIAAWAVTQSNYDAIHILSHGSEGVLNLGSISLNNSSLTSATVQAELAQLGQALTADGDLLLYGCDTAAGSGGSALLDGLAHATGADVAASTDATGTTSQGGNWTLETHIGQIETEMLRIDDYQDLLTLVTITNSDANYTNYFFTKIVNGRTFTFTGDPNYGIGMDNSISGPEGLYAFDTNTANGVKLTITIQSGYCFDLSGLDVGTFSTHGLSFKYTDVNNQSQTLVKNVPNGSWQSLTGLNSTINDVVSIVITADDFSEFQYFDFTDIKSIAPTTVVISTVLSSDTGSSGSDFITKVASQTITGTLSAVLGSGERVEVSYDNGATWSNATSYTVGSSSWSTTTTLSGSNTFAARVTNANASSTAYAQSYILDTAAPATPAAPTLAVASDTGSSSSDNITSVITPTLNGTAEAGSTVTLYDTDGVTVLGSTTANGSGNWSITSSFLAAGAHSLSVIATDTAGNRSTASAKLNVTIDTSAPTAPSLSTNSVATSMATAGATVATLSSSDNSSVTYELAIGNGTNNADNSSFTITGNTLQVNGAALSAGTYHIYLKATDAAGNATYWATTVTVQDPPTVTSIVRAAGASALVPGSATQIEYTVTFSEAVTGVDANDFALTSYGTAFGTIASVSGSGATYTITVSGISGDGSLRLDLKSSGTGIQGTSSNIAGGYTNGQTFTLDHTAPVTPTVPTLDSASDTGASSSDRITNNNTPTLTGTAEAGSTVSIFDEGVLIGSATATGGTWSFTPLMGLNEGPHNFQVTATDAAGNVSTRSTALQITIDTSAPGVNSVAVPADGTYQTGETLTFNVNFNEAVLVDTSGGTPRIALTVGGTTRYATYVSGSGSNTLVFSYVVVNGDSDSDGITVGALSTNGGSVRDIAGNDASTTINGMGSTTAVLVDGTVASVTGISATSGNGSYGAGSTITITVDFSSAVDVDTTGGTPSLSLSSGGTAIYIGGSGTGTLTFSYTVGAGQNSADLDYSRANALQLNGASITESSNHRAVAVTLAAPGSAGSLGANKNLVIDTVAPTAVNQSVFFSADTGNSGIDLITKTAAQTINGTLSGTLASDESVWVSLDNGSHWTKATVTGSNWALSSQTLNAGGNTLQVRVQDAAGNYGPVFAAAYVLDATAPTVSISSNTSTLKAGEAATITFTFSEQVSDFTLGDLTATGGTLSNFSTTTDPLVYTVTFTPSAGFSGSASVTLGNNLYTDIAGNNGSGSSSPTLTVDTIIPTLSISSNHSNLKAGETGLITFTFSEAPSGFNITDVTISGGTLSDFAATANPLVYTAIVTPTAGINVGTLSVTVAAGTFTDVAGNASQASSSVAISYDTAAPTTSATSVVFSNDTGTSSTDLVTSGTSQTISGMLSANLVAGETVEVSLDNGNTWSIAAVSSNAWSLATVLTGSGVLQVRVVDVAGNSGPVFSSAYVLDQSPPTVVITSNVATVNGMEPALITFTFSEVPVGFNAGDIYVSGGTLNNFTPTSNPLVYTATFTADSNVASGSATISVLGSGYSDAAGNAGTSATIPLLQIDTVGPAAIPGGVSFNQDSGVNGDLITNVAGQVISGNLSAPLASGDTVQISLDNGASWTIVPTSIGDTSWSISQTLSQGSNTLLVKVSDAAGNYNLGTPQAYELDTTAPVAGFTAMKTESLVPTLSGSSSLVAGESMTVTVGGATYLVIPTAGTGTWSLDLATAVPISGALSLARGQQYSVVVATLDTAGNHGSSSGTLTITIPVVVPTTPEQPTPTDPDQPIVPLHFEPVVVPYISPIIEPASSLPNFVPSPGAQIGLIPAITLPVVSQIANRADSDLGSWPSQTATNFLDTLPGFVALSPAVTLSSPIADSIFQINVVPGLGGDSLTVNRPIPDVASPAGQRIAVQLSSDAFTQSNANSTVTLSAGLADGSPLPGWLSFDARTGRFEGTPPPGFTGSLSIKVIVRDSQGHMAVQVFKLVVNKDASKTALWQGDTIAPTGRASLSEQMRSAHNSTAARLAVLS